VLDTLTKLFSLLQSGVADIFANGIEVLHLKVEQDRIDLDLMNKELLTDFLKNADARDHSLSRKLAMLRSVAQRLKSKGLTLTISVRGSLLLTLGLEAKPGFSRVFTGTDAIEVNNMSQLSQLILQESLT
jgi:hypothetical protein